MKKKIFSIIALCSVWVLSYAQPDSNGAILLAENRIKPAVINYPAIEAMSPQAVAPAGGFDWSRVVIGGSLGLQFGNYTIIDISPRIGYRLSDYVTLGAGIGYIYFRDRYFFSGSRQNLRASYLNMNIFGDFFPFGRYFVLSVQPEASRMWRTYDRPDGSRYRESKFVPSLLVGGGLRMGNVTARIMYDVVQNDNSPYSSGIFYSIGYTFSF